MAGLDGFDGADQLRRAWLAGLAPDPAVTVSRWADQYCQLPSIGVPT